jgi:prevent-host-death family protein
MPIVGVRELKIHASEIIRRVRDEKLEYVVTFHGRPVGLLIPIDEAAVEEGTVSAARAFAQEAIREMLSSGRRERPRAAPSTPEEGKPAPRRAPATPAPESPVQPLAQEPPPAPATPEPTAKPLEPQPERPAARPRPRRTWAPWSR